MTRLSSFQSRDTPVAPHILNDYLLLLERLETLGPNAGRFHRPLLWYRIPNPFLPPPSRGASVNGTVYALEPVELEVALSLFPPRRKASFVYRLLSAAGSPAARTVLVIAGALRLYMRGRPADALFLVSAVGGTGACNTILKRIVARRRPRGSRKGRQHSFPSGHASGSLALIGAAIYLTWTRSKRASIIVPLAAAGASLTGLIGVSRVKLRRHHPGDVVGGYLLGAAGLVLTTRLVGVPEVEQQT